MWCEIIEIKIKVKNKYAFISQVTENSTSVSNRARQARRALDGENAAPQTQEQPEDDERMYTGHSIRLT